MSDRMSFLDMNRHTRFEYGDEASRHALRKRISARSYARCSRELIKRTPLGCSGQVQFEL